MRPRRLLLPAALALSTVLAACGGGGGGGSTATTSTTSSTTSTPPTAQLSATAKLDGTTDLVWSSTNASSCTISGSYSGTVGASGTLNVTPPLNDNQSYSLSCTGSGGTVTAAATPAPLTNLAQTCGNISNTMANYAYLGGVVLGNASFPVDLSKPRVTSTSGFTNCISGSVAADGTATVNASWSEYDISTQNLMTYISGMYGYMPLFNLGLTSPVNETTDATFPVQVSSVSPTLGVTYNDTIISNTGNYDLIADMWFSSTQFDTSASNQTLELIVTAECPSYGCYKPNVVDTTVINGISYTVDYAVYSGNSTPTIDFIPASNIPTGTVTLKPFLDYAVAHGYLNASNYLQGIYLGHEIFAGNGSTSFTMKLNK